LDKKAGGSSFSAMTLRLSLSVSSAIAAGGLAGNCTPSRVARRIAKSKKQSGHWETQAHHDEPRAGFY
jgi:hypothetical protein